MPEPPAVTRAAIALGSNLGDRAAHIDAALASIAAVPRISVVAVSAVIQTAPVGPAPQGPFLNAAALLDTSLTPRDLLAVLHEIERRRGRDRSAEKRWGPRTLDLDLLLFGSLVIDEPGLTVPHPRMHERRFVLEPLAQIAPGWIVPTLGKSVADLLAACPPA